jgi:hypothetical protein
MLMQHLSRLGFAAALFVAATATGTVGRAQQANAQSGDANQTVTPAPGSNNGKGVITPPPTNDQAINKAPPPAEIFPTPVVPPPGTPGGNPKVVPK